MLDICIMGLLRMRMDALHYALLAALVLLVLYAARSHGMFKEGAEGANISLPEGASPMPGYTGHWCHHASDGIVDCWNEELEHTYPHKYTHDNGHTKLTKIAIK